MEKLRRWIARLRDWLGEIRDRERRTAAVPYGDRYADEIAAWKVVRDALLVH